jgi:hypothetical protein
LHGSCSPNAYPWKMRIDNSLTICTIKDNFATVRCPEGKIGTISALQSAVKGICIERSFHHIAFPAVWCQSWRVTSILSTIVTFDWELPRCLRRSHVNLRLRSMKIPPVVGGRRLPSWNSGFHENIPQILIRWKRSTSAIFEQTLFDRLPLLAHKHDYADPVDVELFWRSQWASNRYKPEKSSRWSLPYFLVTFP